MSCSSQTYQFTTESGSSSVLNVNGRLYRSEPPPLNEKERPNPEVQHLGLNAWNTAISGHYLSAIFTSLICRYIATDKYPYNHVINQATVDAVVVQQQIHGKQ
jgi:hypothetical protein